MLNAICAGFKDTPNICKPILEDDDLKEDFETSTYQIHDHGYEVG